MSECTIPNRQYVDGPCGRWKYMRSIVLDGNFTAQHRRMKNPEDDVAFADGHSFMVEDAPYKAHLKAAKEFKEVRISNRCCSPSIG